VFSVGISNPSSDPTIFFFYLRVYFRCVVVFSIHDAFSEHVFKSEYYQSETFLIGTHKQHHTVLKAVLSAR